MALSGSSRDIFSPRINIKPYEYPELLEYVEAIRNSYWVHLDYNYDPDIQDMKVNMSKEEVQAVERTMLAISQIESAVKTFWGNMHHHLPKPEIAKVGATFSESEVRHEDAYSHLLEKLQLNDQFTRINQIPAMWDRIAYINKINRKAKESIDPKDYFKSIIFFSMLIENVSLFSQFFIILSFDKHKKMLKGMSNAVEATSKEEDQHASFGFDIINIMKQEHPEWWTKELADYIAIMAQKAFKAEQKVLDWIYEGGDLEVAPRAITETFIANRLNSSLKAIGIDPILEVDKDLLAKTKWFDDEETVTKQGDLFQKRNNTYTKHNKPMNAEDLF
jgi:ribonucleoside-diphosphate reductase beta chain